MKFKYQDWREKHAQDYDREKITIKMAGKEFNVYDSIQEAREDTEIVPTLEKYGCLEGHIAIDNNKMFGDFTEFKDLRTLKEMEKKADQMFYSLPLDVRQKFNNDKSIFMRDGENWLKNEIEKANTPKQEEEENVG